VSQVVIPQNEFARLLHSAGKAILVGGQALAFWIARYDVAWDDAPEAIVTKDADFLGRKDDVERMAAAVGGSIEYPKTMNILVGVIRKRISVEDEYEVDILWRLNGLSPEEIRRHAVQVSNQSGARFFVMSPTDCLISRLENLRLIPAKQTPSGEWQARVAVRVARAYIEELLGKQDERDARRAATTILTAATHSMGINAFRKYGIDVLEAVPVAKFKHRGFFEQQWPQSLRRIEKVRGLGSPGSR
jgi:hypothetical protein